MKRRNRPHCRLCGTTRDLTRHHLIPQREASRLALARIGFAIIDVRHRDNIVLLCRHHHDAVELGILRTSLRVALLDREAFHIERVAGLGWLDTYYPPPPKGIDHVEGEGTGERSTERRAPV